MTRRWTAARFPQRWALALGLSSKALRFKKRKEEERDWSRRRNEEWPFQRTTLCTCWRYGFSSAISCSLFFFTLFSLRVPSHSLFLLFLLLLLFSIHFFSSLLLFLGNLTLTLKVISSHGHRGLPTKMSPKFLFPDSIPFHLTSRKLLFDSSLCRRSPLFPMHMTVSKKTHCARRLQPLTRIFPRALYRAAAITRRAFRCLSSSFRRRKRRGWFAFSERPIKNRIKKRKKRERWRKEGTKGENRGGGKREFISVRRPSIEWIDGQRYAWNSNRFLFQRCTVYSFHVLSVHPIRCILYRYLFA